MIERTNVKINLGLNVISKRSDGYHNLETVFIPYYNIGDTLEIVTGDDYSRTLASMVEKYGRVEQGISEDGKVMISIAGNAGWDPLKDLTAKAAMMLGEDFDLPPLKIFLEKTAPVGAGLGGGSADAAFALKMIDSLAGLGLTEEQLLSYAARLGSDCAFFVLNRPAFASGRGEVLEPIDINLEEFDIEVVVPEGISVSTADAYGSIVPRTPEMPLREVLGKDPSCWKGLLKNDFEATVFQKYPSLAGVKEELYKRGAVYASMSGSGSAFFALFAKS